MEPYDDDYATCAETYSTFRIFSGTVSAERITRLLHVQPSQVHAIGDLVNPRMSRTRKEHAWFLSSDGRVVSRDTRRHLDWLLDQLEPSLDDLRRLRTDGAQMDVVAYYVSLGQGGPWITSRQMERLAAFGVDCWWDVYFRSDSKDG